MQQGLNRKWWWLSLLVVLAGLGSSLYLTILHFSLLKSGAVGMTLCNLSSYINCDMVLLSRYSKLGTIPLAGLGLVFYLYVLGAILYARMAGETAREILTLPILLTLFSVLLSIVLAYISLVQIEALCIFCNSLYLINFLLMIFLVKAVSIKMKELGTYLKKISWVKSLAYFFIVFAAGSVILHTNHKQFAKEIPQEALEKYLGLFFKRPASVINTDGRPYWGNPNGKIVIAEFADYECPYCKRAAFGLKPLLSDYRDEVKLVYMNYPLDKSCNPHMQREAHRRACATAFAAYCAGQQGKFWEYHDKAFGRQPKFQPESLTNIAQKLKLDMKKFQACLVDDSTRAAILADIEEGDKADIQGTPAIYVNGRPFQLWSSRKAWDQLIERLRAEQKTSS